VLILLPPSEGKTTARRGKPLDLDALSFPELSAARRKMLSSLVTLCSGDPESARTTLGLPPGLADEVARNAALESAPTTEARRVYSGVLYDALGFDSLTPAASRRAASRVLMTSSVFGLLRPTDRIPAYRLSGHVTLPDVGTVASVWRDVLGDVLAPAAARRLIVDLRSGTYVGFWRPPREIAHRVVTVRVLHEVAGRRSVVSHFNKATKGRLVRDVLEDGRDARTPAGFADLLSSLGWRIEPTPVAGGRDKPSSYDVIVSYL
jgi:cytoplasmic iron level regulating protein YaaA (DUF328/UPF0246 family)